MLKNFGLIWVFLIGGGCTPPPFDFDSCKTQCDLCTINNCTDICSQLQNGIDSINCTTESHALWDCALIVGCTFGDECIDEINDFLLCQ